MTPQTKPIEQKGREEPRTQEPFVRQVEDHSLPAQEVLSQPQEDGEQPVDERPHLFVP